MVNPIAVHSKQLVTNWIICQNDIYSRLWTIVYLIHLYLFVQLFSKSDNSDGDLRLFENDFEDTIEKQACHTMEAAKLVEYDLKHTLEKCLMDIFGPSKLIYLNVVKSRCNTKH